MLEIRLPTADDPLRGKSSPEHPFPSVFDLPVVSSAGCCRYSLRAATTAREIVSQAPIYVKRERDWWESQREGVLPVGPKLEEAAKIGCEGYVRIST